MDKAEYLASVQVPSLRPTRIVTESMSVHLYGAAAMVNGVPGRFKRLGSPTRSENALRTFGSIEATLGSVWPAIRP
jgi:hypothetical protein